MKRINPNYKERTIAIETDKGLIDDLYEVKSNSHTEENERQPHTDDSRLHPPGLLS